MSDSQTYTTTQGGAFMLCPACGHPSPLTLTSVFGDQPTIRCQLHFKCPACGLEKTTLTDVNLKVVLPDIDVGNAVKQWFGSRRQGR